MTKKALKLRVVTVAPGVAANHSLGQETFTPESYQPLGVQVSWM